MIHDVIGGKHYCSSFIFKTKREALALARKMRKKEYLSGVRLSARVTGNYETGFRVWTRVSK